MSSNINSDTTKDNSEYQLSSVNSHLGALLSMPLVDCLIDDMLLLRPDHAARHRFRSVTSVSVCGIFVSASCPTPCSPLNSGRDCSIATDLGMNCSAVWDVPRCQERSTLVLCLASFYSRRNSLLFRRLYMPWSCPSVRLSVLRHIPVFCRDEWSYDHAVFTDR